jgi:hypothetical protein
MNGETRAGFSTISLGRLQCVRRVSAGPTERRRRRRLWKWASACIGFPFWGNMEDRFFPRAFERREILLLLGEFYEEIERHVK